MKDHDEIELGRFARHGWKSGVLTLASFLALVIAVFGAGFPVAALSQEVRMAPLNPEFVEWVTRQEEPKEPIRLAPEGYGLGLIPSPVDLSHLAYHEPEFQSLRAVPSSYDLRTLGRLTPVKNQNPYGTCWAFASYGSLESCLLGTTGETHDFAENHLVNLDGFDYGFDNGGNAFMSTAYLAKWAGPVNESADPYPNPGWSPTGLTPVKHVYSVEIIPRRTSSLDNDAIKGAVMDHGALFASMYWISSAYNASTYAFYRSSSATCNHGVAIVGWDDQYPRDRFVTQPPGDGAFIVRNSWGTNWGENGYFYISYYDAVFAKSDPSWLFLNADPTTLHTQVYQYDPLGWVGYIGLGSTTGWGANIFTATSTGELNAVSFYACAMNTSYQILVYSGVSPGQPGSGTLRVDHSGSLINAGYHTITLPSTVSLGAGTAFSVVLKFTTPGYNYPIPIECAVSGYSSQATAAPGQSYYSVSGQTWTDLTSWISTGNVCIKAFMRPASVTTPTVITTAVSAITQTTASSGGNVTADGGATVTSRGVCWSTTANPTIANSKTTDGTGTGSFSSSITGLSPGTTYYVRAYATNIVGTAYGSQVDFMSKVALTTAANPAAGGTVTKNPDKASYDHGENVQVTATANAGYTFTGWSGDLSGRPTRQT